MNTGGFSWILLLEAALPFVILSIVLILTIMSGRKKFKQAARLLILSVKSNEDKEKQAVFKFLTETLKINPIQAKKSVKKILNERKFLVRNLVSGLLDKNVEALSQINQDLCRVTEKYHSLSLGEEKQEEPVEPEEETQQETEEQPDLKAEIKSLKQEVHITLTTLNNIFKEFSSMFGEDDVPEGQMSVDQIITAMESFSGKAPSTESSEAAEPSEVAEPGSAKDDAVEDNSTAVEKQQDNAEVPSGDIETEKNNSNPESDDEADENIEIEEAAADTSDEKDESDELDFSVDGAIDDIDSALDDLELDASGGDEEEPDWGDAFAESGDSMDDDDDDKKS